MKKIKSIVMCGLLLLGAGAATTSCEDMFTAENKLVTTDLAPQDTVYQMMGIVKAMQKLADRTVLLGEIRADLVDVDATVASTDLQQLYNNAISTDNVYNKPADYYAVINNCNIYLAYVDSLLKSHGESYYKREICAAKCFRAWCYLELVKIYGKVPFVTQPVLTASAAEDIVASGEKADMATILDFCINDLQEYPSLPENEQLRPQYVTFSITGPFLYVRALLGELYLWRGTYTNNHDDYIEAIRMYHDYLCFPSEERSVNFYSNRWRDRYHMRAPESTYGYRFMSITNIHETDKAGVIYCDTSAYYGNTSDLRMIFNSQPCNNYYAWVSPSERIRNISAAQDYCFYQYSSASVRDTLIFDHEVNNYEGLVANTPGSLLVGDLRLTATYSTLSNLSESQYNSKVNSTKSFVMKWLSGASSINTDAKQDNIPFIRNTIIYLHMAEALNRAGFPETAFAVLKYGLTYKVMENRDIISEDEFYRLCKIKSRGFSLIEPKYTGEVADTANSSFVIWRSTVFDNPNKERVTGDGGSLSLDASSEGDLMQIGIHSIGSGDSEYNDSLYLDDAETKAGVPQVAVPEVTIELDENSTAEDSLAWEAEVEARDKAIADNKKMAADYYASDAVRAKRQARVAQLILEEEALEGVFEGYRFYDLMRYQMQEGKFTNTITMPDYITEKYGPTDRLIGKPWYLTLPAR